MSLSPVIFSLGIAEFDDCVQRRLLLECPQTPIGPGQVTDSSWIAQARLLSPVETWTAEKSKSKSSRSKRSVSMRQSMNLQKQFMFGAGVFDFARKTLHWVPADIFLNPFSERCVVLLEISSVILLACLLFHSHSMLVNRRWHRNICFILRTICLKHDFRFHNVPCETTFGTD